MAMQCEICGKPVDEGKGFDGTGVYTFGKLMKAYHRDCWEKGDETKDPKEPDIFIRKD